MIFSCIKDGTMTDKENIALFLKKKGLKFSNLVLCEQVHKDNINVVSEKEKGKIINSFDGLITKEKSLLLGVIVADCLPVSFSSRDIFGIVHAGWRGIEMGIIEKIEKEIKEMGRDIKSFLFEIGPSIGPCHFEIKEDLFDKFKKYDSFIQKRNGKIFLDLKGVVKEKIRKMGVDRVKDQNICTFCNNNYYSFRRDNDKKRIIVINYLNNKR